MPLIDAATALEQTKAAVIANLEETKTKTKEFIEEYVVPMIAKTIAIGKTNCNVTASGRNIDPPMLKSELVELGYRVDYSTVRNPGACQVSYQPMSYDYTFSISWS
jgi:hypothetical protein